MKTFGLIIIILSFCVFSCNSQVSEKGKKAQDSVKEYDLAAVALNTKAMQLSFHMDDDSVLNEALDYLAQSIKADSNYYLAYANMATLLLKQQKRDSAISILQIIVDRKPNYAEGLSTQGYIYEKLGEKDAADFKYRQAIKSYEKRIVSNEDDIEAKVNKVFLMLFLYDKKTAFNEIEKVLKEHPEDSFALMMKEEIIPNFDREEFLSSY